MLSSTTVLLPVSPRRSTVGWRQCPETSRDGRWRKLARHLSKFCGLVRRCDALSPVRSIRGAAGGGAARGAVRVQDLNRPTSGFAALVVASVIAARSGSLDQPIVAHMDGIGHLIAFDPALSRSLALVHGVEPKGLLGRSKDLRPTRASLCPPSTSARWQNPDCVVAALHQPSRGHVSAEAVQAAFSEPCWRGPNKALALFV